MEDLAGTFPILIFNPLSNKLNSDKYDTTQQYPIQYGQLKIRVNCISLQMADRVFELSSPQYGPQVPINHIGQKRFLGDIEIIPTNTNHQKVIVVSANDDNAGNQGGFIQMTLDEGATLTYITPEPYIERINLDFAKVSGNAPDNFKALYVVNRPTIKLLK